MILQPSIGDCLTISGPHIILTRAPACGSALGDPLLVKVMVSGMRRYAEHKGEIIPYLDDAFIEVEEIGGAT